MNTQSVAHACAVLLVAALPTGVARSQSATIVEVENIVQTSSGGKSAWNAASPGQSLAVADRIRTRQRSRATMALTGLYMVRLDQFTTLEITPRLVGTSKPTLDLLGGAAFIFSRERSGEIDVRLPAANAALRGTQLFAQALPGGKSRVQVLEGQVELSNAGGKLVLQSGQAGEVAPGQAPHRTAVLDATQILQWALYYPAVLDPDAPGLGGGETGAMAKSLSAYRRGNLLEAVAALPAQAPGSPGARVYQAGVLLAVGRVDEARSLLAGVSRDDVGRQALERLIAAAQHRTADAWPVDSITTAAAALAESYYLQSQGKLEPARAAALRATGLAPHNGYAWTRLAELEFSFARTKPARAAIEQAAALTPDNARTHALRGFILSADNRIADARAEFERTVRLDGGFGNGWLGLGLTKIKLGDLAGGRADLQTAATVEPTQSIFHSYLGKAMSHDKRPAEAAKDLALARRLDPNDPTPLLYAALENERNNRPNTAIADLEESIRLNDNRRLYRSEFLLDEDRAVRGANLARIYQNSGMKEVAVREATRAVESDYTNASAHLFLANSFDAMRDPNRVLLRYETPWFNELLLANLLSPVGGGPLSQFVSQQEYSKLLEADGIGGSFTTQWRSNSELQSSASVFGTHGNVSYGLDAYYRNDPGERPHAAMDLKELYGQLKWQATPDDILYFLGKWSAQASGDNFQNYANHSESPGFRFDENQRPGLLLAGWNHRWAPGSNTLFLGGWLSAEQSLTDPASNQLLIQRDTSGMHPGFLQTNALDQEEFTDPALRNSVGAGADGHSLVYTPELLRAIAPYIGTGALETISNGVFGFATRRTFDIGSAEVQHIWQTDHNTLLFGGRWQQGRIDTDATLTFIKPAYAGGFPLPAADQHYETDFRRIGLYLYDYWKVVPHFTLIGGVSWDSINHPDNFRNPPIDGTQQQDQRLCGKFGFTYEPSRDFTLRGMAASGMGGVTYDESVRLEPSQLAGFNQAYRTVISESLVGSVEAPYFQTCGLSAEGRFDTRTWWGASVNLIKQDVSRTLGTFTGYDSQAFASYDGMGNLIQDQTLAYFPSGTTQHLDYREACLAVTLNQLIGSEFAIGLNYQLTRSELHTVYPQLRPMPGSDLTDKATLQEVSLHGDWNSPAGWFAHAEANCYHQSLDDDPSRHLDRAGDSFVQFNAWAGYRFDHNLCEVAAGVLNIGNTDYQLSPLNPYGQIPRDRTFFMVCRMSF